MNLSLDAQDVIIRKRLEVDERPLKKLCKKLLQLANANGALAEGSSTDLSSDFQLYNHTLRRLSLLSKANQQEVERHEAEAAIIRSTHTQSQAQVEDLKRELTEERRLMADRASFDALAREIQEQAPKSRKGQTTVITRLEEEIAELESEKTTYSETWQLRKTGFEDIMIRLLDLQKEISGEKADAELRDAAEDSEDEEGMIASTSKKSPSSEAQSSEPILQDNYAPKSVADETEMMDLT